MVESNNERKIERKKESKCYNRRVHSAAKEEKEEGEGKRCRDSLYGLTFCVAAGLLPGCGSSLVGSGAHVTDLLLENIWLP